MPGALGGRCCCQQTDSRSPYWHPLTRRTPCNTTAPLVGINRGTSWTASLPFSTSLPRAISAAALAACHSYAQPHTLTIRTASTASCCCPSSLLLIPHLHLPPHTRINSCISPAPPPVIAHHFCSTLTCYLQAVQCSTVSTIHAAAITAIHAYPARHLLQMLLHLQMQPRLQNKT